MEDQVLQTLKKSKSLISTLESGSDIDLMLMEIDEAIQYREKELNTSNKPVSSEQAQQMGAKGGEPTEEERILFEAWMKGHCWFVGGQWNGKTYVDPSERGLLINPNAMDTRRLWAAWRDRAALSRI